MKIAVISYSLTGNNEALASSIATALEAKHIKITEPKKRTVGTIAWDMLFNRTPKVKPETDRIDGYDLVIFVGPVWMGQIASPLRAYLRHLKDMSADYAFISISGGADGPNPKLEDELVKRTGRKPGALIDLHISDLLPRDPKPTREATSAYHLTQADVQTLTERAMTALKAKIKMEMVWTS